METVDNPVNISCRAKERMERAGENLIDVPRLSSAWVYPQVIPSFSTVSIVENSAGYQKIVYTVAENPLACLRFLCYASETSEDSPNSDQKLIRQRDSLSRKTVYNTRVANEGNLDTDFRRNTIAG